MPSPPARVRGPWVLLCLALSVAGVTAGLVFWTRTVPAVPDARGRMQGMGLPGADGHP